jgi:hypothetical protein
LSIQNRAIGPDFLAIVSEFLRIVSEFKLLWKTTGQRMAPLLEDLALTALLGAPLTVRFLVSGVFLVNHRQRVPRWGGGLLIG